MLFRNFHCCDDDTWPLAAIIGWFEFQTYPKIVFKSLLVTFSYRILLIWTPGSRIRNIMCWVWISSRFPFVTFDFVHFNEYRWRSCAVGQTPLNGFSATVFRLDSIDIVLVSAVLIDDNPIDQSADPSHLFSRYCFLLVCTEDHWCLAKPFKFGLNKR
jgi:hypothetical protein